MPTVKRPMLALTATPEDKEKLEKLAERFGYLHGDRPNVSGLIRAIASGEIILKPLSDFPHSPRETRRPLNRKRSRGAKLSAQ